MYAPNKPDGLRLIRSKMRSRQAYLSRRFGYDFDIHRKSRKLKLQRMPTSQDDRGVKRDDVSARQHASSSIHAAPQPNDCRQLKNDYSQNFVNTGQRPQNFIRDSGIADRFEEYPKLKELIKLKDELISKTNSPPFYLRMEHINTDSLIGELGSCQFDVILLRPPLADSSCHAGSDRLWNWHEVSQLPIDHFAATRSFVFLWANSGEGLDEARSCLRRWGFRRCEDICCIKTNKYTARELPMDTADGIFQKTKEHCLMGIRGTVRRSMDADFIHANVDIDLIIAEESNSMPQEIFDIIEHFCLGRRRLFLFGSDCDIRPGWITIGSSISNSNFDVDKYNSFFDNNLTTGTTERIEQLRPKSPSQHMNNSSSIVSMLSSSGLGNSQNSDVFGILQNILSV